MRKIIERTELGRLEDIDLSSLDLSGGISFFIPAFNEEDNIERAVLTAAEMLSSITDNYEALVVDDASTDRTREIVESLVNGNSHIRIITHEKNTRLGGAMRTGFYRSSKDLVIYCDADNPVDVWDFKRSLPLLKEYDVIIGYRLNREKNLKRKIYSVVYNYITGVLFGFKAEDINFSFKLVKRKVLNRIDIRSTGGFIDAELVVEALRCGSRICQVGVQYYPRTAGNSTMASPMVIIEILCEMWAYLWRTGKRSSLTLTISEYPPPSAAV